MASIDLPSTLTVEVDDDFDPKNPYGSPVSKTVILKFGSFEVFKYTLVADMDGEFWFYRTTHNHRLDNSISERVRFDGPDEFVAQKLRELFGAIN